MTSSEFAMKAGRSYNTVAAWLRKGLIPGAKQETIGNETRWFIPNKRLDDFEQWDPKKRQGKRGKSKTPGAKKAAKSGAKKSGAGK